MRKIDQHTITGTIILKSNTRIGGSDDILQIGGTDLTCIKDPITEKPYIPGSSLKGRMRSQLEIKLNKLKGNEPCGCVSPDCPVCRIFGPHKPKNMDHHLGPTRIIVRDAPLTKGGELVLKPGNIINRNTGGSQNYWELECVRPESEFKLEISIQEYDIDSDFTYRVDASGSEERGGKALIEVVLHCLTLVRDTGIGSGTSKGYGQIDIVVDPQLAPKRPRLTLSAVNQP